MSERSTPPPLESASYVEVSLAKISPTPEGELASTGTVPDSGPSSLASFAFYDPASSLLRTCQRSLDGEWAEYSETCPSSGTMRSGRLYAHPTWALHTAENESSLWPTPDANVFNDGQTVEAWEAREAKERAKGYNGNGGGIPLAMRVRMWPTATVQHRAGSAAYSTESGRHAGTTLADAANGRWATPTARDWKSGQHSEATAARNSRPLNEQVWATPLARDSRGPTMGENAQGSAPLSQQVAWPTPTRADAARGGGKYARGNLTLVESVKRSCPADGAPSASIVDSGASSPSAPNASSGEPSYWPTPQARDEKGPTGAGGRDRRSSLSDSAMPEATAGRLNPAWVESLMGFPLGWTDGLPVPPKRSKIGSRRERSPALPSTDPHDSEPSETPSSRSAPRQDPGEGSSK